MVTESDGFEALFLIQGRREAADERGPFFDDSIGLAGVTIHANTTAVGLRRILGDLRQLKRPTIGDAKMSRGVNDPNRMLGRGLIKVVASWVPLLFDERVVVAATNDPFS